jgi:hypothetical protein
MSGQMVRCKLDCPLLPSTPKVSSLKGPQSQSGNCTHVECATTTPRSLLPRLLIILVVATTFTNNTNE